MGIQYIPGSAELLAPAIASIGESIGKLINPNFQLQQGMKQALATNPALLGQLADVEAVSPGTLQRLGLGSVGDTISKTPQSAKSKFEQTNKDKIVKGAEASLEAETAQAGLTRDQAIKMGEMMRADPKLAVEDALRKITGETESQRLNRPNVELEAEQSKETLASLRQFKIEGLGDLDMVREVKQWMKGGYPTSKLMTIFAKPEALKAWNDALNLVTREKNEAHDKLLQGMRDAPNLSDTFFQQKAFQMYNESGNAGTPQLWRDYMYGNGGVGRKQEAESLVGKQNLTPEQRDLVEIYQADRAMKFAASRKIIGDYNTTLMRSVTAFRTEYEKGAPDAELNQYLLAIQESLDNKASLTGQKITARYGEIPNSSEGWFKFGNDDGLYFVDENGKPVNPGTLFADTVPTTKTQEQVQNQLNEVAVVDKRVSDYFALSVGERAAALARWKAEDPTPDKRIYNQIYKAIKEK